MQGEKETETIINLNKVSCKIGYRHLIKDITWEIQKGECWCVFGMNGSGKTTLLSTIAGFQHYTKGTVQIFGEPFSNENMLNIRKRIGWVSTSFFDKYYHKESALHIVLSGKNGTLGLSDDITLEDVRFAKFLLRELQLGNRENQSFQTFSKGERQNILIARALFSRPEILILDEPCNGLDIFNRNRLFKVIETLHQETDITIIYVTHYVEEILPIFQKTLLLKGGQIFAKGPTEEMLTNKLFAELLGYPVVIGKDNKGRYHIDTEDCIDLSRLMKSLGE